ncbi:unnamed protein product, partial [Urochloa humidicola]
DKFSKKPRTAQTLTPHTHAPLSLLFAVASPLSLLFAVASPLLPSCLHRSSPPPPPPSLPPLRRRLATPPTFTASLRCTARFSGSRSRAARSGSDCATTLALARGSARPAWNTAHGLQRRKFRRGVVAPRNLARANLSARQPRSREGPWSTSTPGSALPRCPRGPNPGPPRPRRRPLRSASSPLPPHFSPTPRLLLGHGAHDGGRGGGGGAGEEGLAAGHLEAVRGDQHREVEADARSGSVGYSIRARRMG